MGTLSTNMVVELSTIAYQVQQMKSQSGFPSIRVNF